MKNLRSLKYVRLPGILPLIPILCLTAYLQSCGNRKAPENEGPAFIRESFIHDRLGDQLLTLEQYVRDRMNVMPQSPDREKPFLPRSLDEEGRIMLVSGGDWCSGFYPGCLWQMYELTGETSWETLARAYTGKLEQQQWNTSDHDIGFRMMCSYGNGYRLTGDSTYRQILIRSARSLITRYNDTVGCIRSWDWNQDVWKFPVIIDNMMNLELLFLATRETGDSLFHRIALRHARTTMQHHFRPDHSSWHVVDFDPGTGAVRMRVTHQGYSDESAWARGQAWGLYGFTMTYRFTEDPEFLDRAEKIASFILGHPNLPEDHVPYWDYDAPGIPDEPRDASAAAITASALLELSGYSPEGDRYRDAALKILESLSSPAYLSARGENKGFLLDHSTGNRPGNSEVDVPIIYADYYFLEALKRAKNNP